MDKQNPFSKKTLSDIKEEKFSPLPQFLAPKPFIAKKSKKGLILLVSLILISVLLLGLIIF